jgi:hypothetical protein
MKTIRSLTRIALTLLLAASASNLFAQKDPATFKVGDLTFTRPAQWQWVTVNSPMRKAQLKVADQASKAEAEVAFFDFGPGGGGGVQANVDRWYGQFVEPKDKLNSKTEEKTVGKTKITYVQAEGTYKSGMPGAPLTPIPNYGLVGAILQVSADNTIFVRMTGPKALVKASTDDFKKMIEAAPKKD